jgi:hypothetical protein
VLFLTPFAASSQMLPKFVEETRSLNSELDLLQLTLFCIRRYSCSITGKRRLSSRVNTQCSFPCVLGLLVLGFRDR